jgi:hypothetical protein
VALTPEEDLGQVVEVPAVADDAMLLGPRPGQHRRLGRARDRRQQRCQRALPSAAGEIREARPEQGRHQADDIEHHQPVGHGGSLAEATRIESLTLIREARSGKMACPA